MTCTNSACAAAVTTALTTAPTSSATRAVSCAMHAASTTPEATITEDPEDPKTMTCDELTCDQKKTKQKIWYMAVCVFFRVCDM